MVRKINPNDIMKAPSSQGGGAFFIQPSDLSAAMKSMPYNQFIEDFIEGVDSSSHIDTYLIDGAYATSVYLFATIRRLAFMISSVKIVAEVKQNNSWVRLPETYDLNTVFNEHASRLLFDMTVQYALYGRALVYKHKTRKALYYQQMNLKPITRWDQDAVSGLHVIPVHDYTVDELTQNGEIRGFFLNNISERENTDNRTRLERDEAIYVNDFDPQRRNHGISIAQVAIDWAIANSSVGKWISHYFTTGAMPILFVSSDDPNLQTEDDLKRQKTFVERQWRGLTNSLRSVFTWRKLEVQEVGITADKVTAPELNSQALMSISAATGIPADLIVPPQGGSDNARHKHLIKQAWIDTGLPIVNRFVQAFNEDLGLPENVRLVVDEDQISALQADRQDISATEIAIAQSGGQTHGEMRQRMNMPVIEWMKDWIYQEGKWQSPGRVIRGDRSIDYNSIGSVVQLWQENILPKQQIHGLLGVPMPAGEPNEYKTQRDARLAKLTGADPAQQPQQGGAFMSVPLQLSAQLPKSVNLPTKAASVGGASCCWIIPLKHDAAILKVQQMVRAALPDVGVWTPPEDLHLTLCYAPLMTDDQLEAAWAYFVRSLPEAPELVLECVDTFEGHSGNKPVIIRLEKTPGLLALQKACYQAFVLAGTAVSEHSIPHAYNPHITLAYVPSSTPVTCVYLPGQKISGGRVESTRTDYTSINHANLAAPAPKPVNNESQHMVWLSLLQQWDATGAMPAGLPPQLTATAFSVPVEQHAALRRYAAKAVLDGWFDPHADIGPDPFVFLETRYGGTPMRSAQDELVEWKKVAKRSPAKSVTTFKTYFVPLAIDQRLREELAHVKRGDREAIEKLFVEAHESLKATEPDSINEDFLAMWSERIEADDELKALLPSDEDDAGLS